MEFTFLHAGQALRLTLQPDGDGFSATVDGRTYRVRVGASAGRPGELVFSVDGVQHLAWVAAESARRWVAVGGQTYELAVPPPGRQARRPRQAGGHDRLEAQMPGLVRQVLVSPGDVVERGQVLLVLEAMKMEIRVSAPHAGTVEQVAVAEGQAVEGGQKLIDLASRD